MLSFTTASLGAPLRIAGDPIVRLTVAADGVDTDLAVRLASYNFV